MKRLLPWAAYAVCSIALPMGCASDEKPNQQGPSAATAGQSPDGGDGTDSTGSSNPGNTGNTGSTGNTGNDGSTNTNSDGGEDLDPPTLAEACGTDLEEDNGDVRPDLGSVPSGGSFEGDPLNAGKFKIVKADYKVKNPDSTLNDVPLTIYAPSDDGTSIADGKHPLVMVMPGYGKGLGLSLSGTYPTYAFYSEHLASHGFIVVGMNFIAGGLGLPIVTTENLGAHFLTAQEKNVDEVEAVLDFVLADSKEKAQIDETKIAIAGHSEGGKVAFFAAVEDPRFDMVIGWDPQNAGGGSPCMVAADTCNRLPVAPICPDPMDESTANSGRMNELHAETLVFAARDSGAIPDAHQFAENFYRGAPSQAHMLLFLDATHENWSDGDNPVSQATMRAQLALLLTRFQGMTGLDDYLPGADKLVEGIENVEQHNK